jgi:hypothetical protein
MEEYVDNKNIVSLTKDVLSFDEFNIKRAELAKDERTY